MLKEKAKKEHRCGANGYRFLKCGIDTKADVGASEQFTAEIRLRIKKSHTPGRMVPVVEFSRDTSLKAVFSDLVGN